MLCPICKEELSDVRQCPGCGHRCEAEILSNHCEYCGTELGPGTTCTLCEIRPDTRCPACGRDYFATGEFCPHCGHGAG